MSEPAFAAARKPSGPRVAVLASFLAAVVALVAFPIVFGGYTFSNAYCASTVHGPYGAPVTPVLDPGAAASQDEPWLVLIRRSLGDGYAPFVNFDNGLGAPLLESLQAGVLYLGNPLLLLFDPSTPWMFDAFALLHVFGFVAGLYALARLHARTSAALTVAILVGLSGISLQHVDMVHFRAHAWVPWVLWAVTRLARGEGGRPAFVVLAVAHVGLVTSGALQEAFLSSMFALFVFAVEAVTALPSTNRDPWSRSRVARIAVALLSSSAIASVSVVPYLAARAAGDVATASWPERSVEALPPFGLANVFLPHANGFHPYVYAPDPTGRWMTDLGAVAVFLAVLGAAAAFGARTDEPRLRRRRLAYAIAIALGFAKLQGLFVFDVLRHVPFLSEILYVKYHAWMFDACAILGASGLEWTLARLDESGAEARARARRHVLVAFGVTALAAIVFVGGTWWRGSVWIRTFPVAVRHDAYVTYAAAVAAFGGAAAILYLAPRGAWVTRAGVGLVAIAVFHAATTRPDGWWKREASYASRPAPAERVDGQDSRYAARILSVAPPNQNVLQDFAVLGVFDPVCSPRLRMLLNRTFELEHPQYALQPKLGPNTIDERRLAILRLSGVSVVYDHDVDPALGLARTPLGGQVVPDPLPRAWLLSPEDAERFESGSDSVALEKRIEALHGVVTSGPRIATVREVGNTLEFVSDRDFTGRLVLQQAFTHSWRFAGESGRPFLRLFPSWDVELKRGVTYRATYEPVGWKAAWPVAILGFVLLVAGTWWLFRGSTGGARGSDDRVASA